MSEPTMREVLEIMERLPYTFPNMRFVYDRLCALVTIWRERGCLTSNRARYRSAASRDCAKELAIILGMENPAPEVSNEKAANH